MSDHSWLQLTPSSRASPKREPAMKKYTIRVQRNERGRWREQAIWQVLTDEEDMEGPLKAGLKDNYRLIIKQEPLNASRGTDLSGPQPSTETQQPISTGRKEVEGKRD